MRETAFDLATDMLVGDSDPPITADNPVDPVVVDAEPVVDNQDALTSLDGESFTKIDPNTLDPVLAQVYKSMQADYTRKAQEIAGYRKLGADPDTLQRAYEFFNKMDTDPNYAKAVAEHVMNTLGGNQLVQDEEPSDDFDFDDNVPSALQREINELRTWREQMEEKEILNQMSALVTNQEAQIRSANQHYDDGDIEAIYEIAAGMEVPDLIQAEDRYTRLQAAWAQKFMANKTSAKPDVPPVPGSFAQSVVRPSTMGEATDIALKMILGQNGQ